MRIACVTAGDARSRSTWSGLAFYMSRALEQSCGPVTQLGPDRPRIELAGRVLSRARRGLGGAPYNYQRSTWAARHYARDFARKLARDRYDVVFAPAASAETALLDVDIPIVYATDMTFGLARDYYRDYSTFSAREARVADALEARAIARAAVVVVSSQWAARSVRERYRGSRVEVLPFGANFDAPPSRAEATRRRRADLCELVLIAAEWERKGGDVAYAAVRALDASGIPARLTVIGSTPPAPCDPALLRVIPRLDKDRADHQAEFTRLLLDAHVMILPTRADCTPVAVSDASAHGVPSLVTDTGGTSEVVSDGENGYLLPPSATGDDYARLIASLVRDPDRHDALVRSSRAVYEARLNWTRWGSRMRDLLSSL